jgi:hypothetical protein
MLYFSEPEFDIVKAPSFRVLSRLGDHFRCHIDSNDHTRMSNLPCCEDGIEAGPASEVQNGFTPFKDATACGFPHPSPRLQPSGTLLISSIE